MGTAPVMPDPDMPAQMIVAEHDPGRATAQGRARLKITIAPNHVGLIWEGTATIGTEAGLGVKVVDLTISPPVVHMIRLRARYGRVQSADYVRLTYPTIVS